MDNPVAGAWRCPFPPGARHGDPVAAGRHICAGHAASPRRLWHRRNTRFGGWPGGRGLRRGAREPKRGIGVHEIRRRACGAGRALHDVVWRGRRGALGESLAGQGAWLGLARFSRNHIVFRRGAGMWRAGSRAETGGRQRRRECAPSRPVPRCNQGSASVGAGFGGNILVTIRRAIPATPPGKHLSGGLGGHPLS